MHQMSINPDQRAATALFLYDVAIPEFVEESARGHV